MLQTIIPYLNNYLSSSIYFKKNFGLIELIKNAKGQESPKEYCSDGEWKEVSNFDSYNGVSYWRKNGDVSLEEFSVDISCDKFLRINVPLKLIAVIPKKKGSADDAYSSERIINDLIKLVSQSSASLKASLKAMRVNISIPSYSTNSQQVFDTEYKKVSAKNINFNWAYFSINTQITIEIKKDCIIDACEPADSCEILLSTLSTTDRLVCILPSYDFSDDNVIDALTDDQRDALIEAFCGGDVTIYYSNGVTVVTVIAPGGTYTIPKHTIYKSNGSTVVTTKEFDENYSIPKHIIYLSDGTTIYANPEFDVNTVLAPVLITNSVGTLKYTKDAGDTQAIPKYTVYKSNGVTVYTTNEFDVNTTLANVAITDAIGGNTTKEAGESYTCASMNTATCAQLNSTLTDAQRQLIIRVNSTKTGQTTSFRTGDDGDLELGRYASFSTLNCNNPFGNTNRFTDTAGGQTYANDIVLDWSTMKMWYRVVFTGKTWNNAIDEPQVSAQGGFSGWMLPNVNQMVVILNWSSSGGLLNYSPFNVAIGTSTTRIWTSTTVAATTTAAYTVSETFLIASTTKTTGTGRYIMCRTFTLADVGL